MIYGGIHNVLCTKIASQLVWTRWQPWPGATSTTAIPVTGSELDGDQANATIGLVRWATASIVAGGSLVAGEA